MRERERYRGRVVWHELLIDSSLTGGQERVLERDRVSVRDLGGRKRERKFAV